ncbi:4835_t:CDS:1, partial [Dentiscutata erythropus]
MPESRDTSNEGESRDSIPLPEQDTEESTEESSDDSDYSYYEENNNKKRKR